VENTSDLTLCGFGRTFFEAFMAEKLESRMGQLEGKIAMITGAATGIGRATALLCAREGARLLLADINTVAGEQTAAEIRATGAEVAFVAADVSDPAQVARMMQAIVDTYGGLDCAFNNVGIPQRPQSVTSLSLDEWSRVLAVNLTGCFLCVQQQIPLLLQRSGGSIVNMASFSGVSATPMMAAYSSSKHGVIGLTKSVAAEYAKAGIRVNVICPTATDTPALREYLKGLGVDPASSAKSYPAGRLGTVEEIAEVALWLLSDKSSFINGQAICATGGPA
jgi:NAD(P)-dependent dehydrogenase (short-subunit alcohol dehydrogenase family)